MALMQVLKSYYNDQQMTDTNSLVNALMEKPEELSPIITHLAGREEKKFPLSFLSEGVGNTRSIDRFEYEYRVKTHEVNVRPVVSATGTGAGGATFTCLSQTSGSSSHTPSFLTKVAWLELCKNLKPVAGGYEYTLQVGFSQPQYLRFGGR